MYIAVYVDDLLIVGSKHCRDKEDQAEPKESFSDDRSGPWSYYLGMIHPARPPKQNTALSQEAYVDKVAHQFDMLATVHPSARL